MFEANGSSFVEHINCCKDTLRGPSGADYCLLVQILEIGLLGQLTFLACMPPLDAHFGGVSLRTRVPALTE